MRVTPNAITANASGPNLAALMTGANTDTYRQIMERGIALVEQTFSRVDRPFTGVYPHELNRCFDSIQLGSPAAGGLNEVLGELDALYLRDTVYYHHPRYVAHLNCPVLIVSLLAELISTSLNTAVETWDQSAGATFIEQKVLDWTTRLLGLGPAADGVFTTGGTQSNLMGLFLAREHYRLSADTGDDWRRGRILCSPHSHFSLRKAARILGLATDSVVSVATDDHHRMCPHHLNQTLEALARQGEPVLAVAATAGTTDFGSIDPLKAIAELCQHHGIWLHVDAAYGGGLLTSHRHNHRLRGIEQADSVSIDYHKSFFQPLCCSAFLVGDARHLNHLTDRADYLNPLEQTREGAPDAVNKSLQTSRRFDALKMWLTLRLLGSDTIGERLDRVIELTQLFAASIAQDSDTQVAHEPAISTLVFRFHNPGISREANNQCNRQIRKRLSRTGDAVVAGTTINGDQFLKFTLLDPDTPLTTLLDIHHQIKRQGRAISQLMLQAQQSEETVS